MRILLVCHKPPFPVVDGGTFDSAGIALALREAGHDVRILAMSRAAARDSSSPAWQTTMKVDSRPTVTGFLRTFLRREADAVVRFSDPGFEQRLGVMIQENRFDIVQFDGCATAQYRETALRTATRTAVILRAHNDEADLWTKRGRRQGPPLGHLLAVQARRLYAIEREHWVRVGGIAAISPELESAARGAGAARVRFVPVPVDAEAEPVRNGRGLFHLGPMDWWANRAGLGWFLERIWPRIRAEFAGVELHLGGRDTERFAQTWKDQGVVAHGLVPDARAFMRAGGILVAPVLDGSGVSVKVAEGLSLGKPLVTTSIGIRGLGADAARYVRTADTAEEFAGAVLFLLGNEARRDEAGSAGWEFARTRFSRTRVANDLVALYDQARDLLR